MSFKLNQYNQPVGESLESWIPRPRPERVTLTGRFCRLEPLNSYRHLTDLCEAYAKAHDGRDWTYMSGGPFADRADLDRHIVTAELSQDPLHFAVVDLATDKAVGTLALMRIEPAHGVMEVGHVAFSPDLKQTPAATEAHFLLMNYAFSELGYRRYEWKCDSLNAPSRQAAERLGFTYEGLFRQMQVYKGRTRDTTWFSVIDAEWPAVRTGLERWLAPDNFDAHGRQHRRLAGLRGGCPEPDPAVL